MVPTACFVTAFVETANVAEVAPEATVTLAGTVIEVRLLLNDTTTPDVPALPLRLTVPVALPPP